MITSYAKFVCPRCGKTIDYREAKADGYLNQTASPSGVYVCPDCWDRYPPAEDPIVIKGADLRPLKHPGNRRIEDFEPYTGPPVTEDSDPTTQ